MKPLKLSEFFKIIKPEYVYLKLTPTTSIRNYNSSKIAKAVATMHKAIGQQIKRQGRALLFETIPKVSYYIYIEKTKVEFYFIVPKLYIGLMKDKFS